jgi:hypothetical protein
MSEESPAIRKRKIDPPEKEPHRKLLSVRIDQGPWRDFRKKSIDEKRHMFLILEDLIREYLKRRKG